MGKNSSRKRHGFANNNYPFDEEQLLSEAKTWSPDAKINWTKLGTDMQLTCANRGQVVKEFLAEHSIPAALKKRKVACRSKLKLPGGEVSFPVHTTVLSVKHSLNDDIQSGVICLGKQVVSQQHTTFQYHRETTTITENHITLQGRMLSLVDVRKRLLSTQFKMGILRCMETLEMDDEKLLRQLVLAHACIPHDRSTDSLLEAVKTNRTTRYLKVWHDHGKIAGHGHLLVLVASIYDEAFYLTTEEMRERGVIMDVPSVVEEPHLYLLARSGSSNVE